MANFESSQPPAQVSSEHNLFIDFLWQQLPYLILIVLALIGIAYISISPQGSTWYWQALAPVYAMFCIASGWNRTGEQPEGRVRLIMTQILHWGAFLVTMRMVFLPVFQRNLDTDVTGLILLHLLALSTFLAGIYVDWRLSIVGVFLALGLVTIAFFEQATGLIIVVALTAAVIGTLFFWNRWTGQPAP